MYGMDEQIRREVRRLLDAAMKGELQLHEAIERIYDLTKDLPDEDWAEVEKILYEDLMPTYQ